MRAFLLTLLLIGCSQAEPPQRMEVKLTLVKSVAEVTAACGPSPLEPYGCAKVYGKSCEVIAIKPRGFDDLHAVQTIGHELLHCFWGPTHI